MSTATVQFDPALKELLLRRTGHPLGQFLSEEAAAQEVAVVARLVDPSVPVEALKDVARFGPIVTGRIPISKLIDVRQDSNVASLKAARMHGPALAVSVPEIRASSEVIRAA